MAREFEVEVKIRADPERVWQALTDPGKIALWFGWDAPGLADEIQFIFFDHSSADAERMRLDAEALGGQFTEVRPDPDGSAIRAVQPGEPGSGNEFDGMREGWIAFFFQLRRIWKNTPTATAGVPCT
ncbi:MAG: SRPBCC domain-containing protein [Thermoleophilia bacterium]|nr:SRPBCC domain-containing protein [Thermoleophilia bacterium]